MHIAKYTSANIRLLSHIERLNDNYSNSNIDPAKSEDNVFLVSSGYDNLQSMLQADTAQRKALNMPKRRKDAVTFCDVCLTLPAIYVGRKKSEIIDFFNRAKDLLDEKFGKANNIAVAIHMDETTPHMHYAFAPRVNGLYNAKKVLNRIMLKGLHDYVDKGLRTGLPWYKGGIVSDKVEDRLNARDNLALQDYKKLMQATDAKKAEVKALDTTLAQKMAQVEAVDKSLEDLSDKAIKALQTGDKVPWSERKGVEGVVKDKVTNALQAQINMLTAQLHSQDKKIKNLVANNNSLSCSLEDKVNEIDQLNKDLSYEYQDKKKLLIEWGDTLNFAGSRLYQAKKATLTKDDTEDKIAQDADVQRYEAKRKAYNQASALYPEAPKVESLLDRLKVYLRKLKSTLIKAVFNRGLDRG